MEEPKGPGPHPFAALGSLLSDRAGRHGPWVCVVINLTQVELQVELISTVSTFFLSFLSSSFSFLDLVHEDLARSLHLRPSPCEQQQRHRESHKGANKRFHRTAAGSNGLLRAAGSGKAAAARSSSSCGGGEGEKQIDLEALKSTGCPQTVHLPAI